MKIEADLITVLDGKPLIVKFNNMLFNADGNNKGDTAYFKTSSAMIMCWIRFKHITEFNMADLRVAFPEWRRYSRSSLIKSVNPLVKNKDVQQLSKDMFKVLK